MFIYESAAVKRVVEALFRRYQAPLETSCDTLPATRTEDGLTLESDLSGKELFFNSGSAAMVAEIERSPNSFRPNVPVQLFQTNNGQLGLSRKSQRFLLARPLDQGVQTPFTVVMTWQATLKRN